MDFFNIIEVFTSFILILSLVLTLFIYLTLKLNNSLLESSIKGLLWLVKEIVLFFAYWFFYFIFFPFRIFLKLYFIFLTIILKLINIPLKSFLKYGRGTSLNIFWEETELYFYHTVRESIRFLKYLRRLSKVWVERVAPVYISISKYGVNKIFIWGYIVRYISIFCIFSYLKIKQNLILIFQRVLGLEIFYTIFFLLYYLYIYLKNIISNSFLWYFYSSIKKFLFLASSHWINFHIWVNIGADLGFWKFKKNLEEWNFPRWLFQNEYSLEELYKHNNNNEYEYSEEVTNRYSVLSWTFLIVFLIVYQLVGIISLFILPINIYLFIFRNEQLVKRNYNNLKLNIYNFCMYIFGKNWLIYLPFFLFWSISWITASFIRFIPSLIYLSFFKFIKFLWKIRVAILLTIFILLTFQDVEYTKIISVFTLGNLWFSWMFWSEFTGIIINFNNTGTWLDIWHPGECWNPNMRGSLLLNYKDLIVEKWMDLLLIDHLKETVFEMEIYEDQKLAWDYIKSELNWQTILYHARSTWSLQWWIGLHKLWVNLTITYYRSVHWWYYTYQKCNLFYKFCLILTFFKKFMLIPIQFIGYSHENFKNLPVIGGIYYFFETLILYILINIWTGLKFVLLLFLQKSVNYTSNNSSIFFGLIKDFIIFFYKISIYNFIAKYYGINLCVNKSILYWNWYLNIIFIDFYNDIITLKNFIKNPFILNIAIIDSIIHIFNLIKNEHEITQVVKSDIMSFFFYPLYQWQLFIDKIYIYMEFPLTFQEYMNEHDVHGEPIVFDPVFRLGEVKSRKMFLNTTWINHFDDYFEALESNYEANEFYARREYNWNEKNYKPQHLMWYKLSDPIIYKKYMDYNKSLWVWFEHKHWWWVYYRTYEIIEEPWWEPIRKYLVVYMQLFSVNTWKLYYLLLIFLILINKGFKEFIHNDFSKDLYTINRETAWRLFRNEKPKNLQFLFIEPHQVEVIEEFTNLTQKRKDIRELYNKFLSIHLQKKFDKNFYKKLNKKLEKNISFKYRTEEEEILISKTFFEYCFNPQFKSLRNTITLYTENIMPFIAYYYGKNNSIKRAWGEFDNAEYSVVYDLTYEEKHALNYIKFWEENIWWLESINEKWFNNNLKNWLMTREKDSLEIIYNKNKIGDVEYEYEDTEISYIPYSIFWWFLLFPLMFFYQAYSVQASTTWIWQPLGNYFNYDFLPFYRTVFSHFNFLYDLSWILPEFLVSDKDAGSPSMPGDVGFAGDFYPSNYVNVLYYTPEEFLYNGIYDRPYNFFYTTNQNSFQTIDELKIFEYIRLILFIIFLFISCLFKRPPFKNLSIKPLNYVPIVNIRSNLKKIWFWK